MHRIMIWTTIVLFVASPTVAQTRIDPSKWVTVQDYPPASLAANEQGVVRISYKLDANGHPQQCRVEYTDAPYGLAEKTCDLITQNARYIPAHNKNGEVIVGKDMTTVRWIAKPMARVFSPADGDFGGAIPSNSPVIWFTDDDYPRYLLSGNSARVILALDIAPSGTISKCSNSATGNSSPLITLVCATVVKRAKFTMPVDDHGEPMATKGLIVVNLR